MLYYIFVFFGVCDVCVLSSPNAVAVPSTFSAALVCAYRIAALVYLGREVPNSLLFTVRSCLLLKTWSNGLPGLGVFFLCDGCVLESGHDATTAFLFFSSLVNGSFYWGPPIQIPR